MNLLEDFKQYIQKEHLFLPKDQLLLAVSGGVDSVVLCELCKRAGYNFSIAHCNFQLRGEASVRDEAFVIALAQQYGVVLYKTAFDTLGYAANSKKSIEEAARDLRYEWFYSLIGKRTGVEADDSATVASYIVTAHHGDDNIETVLLNFFRGTGIAGIRGILPKQESLVRPLLFARKIDLENFAGAEGLEYVTDHTNLENDYTRNYFRNTIIPLVKKSFPEAEKNVLANIRRFRETELIYQSAIRQISNKLLEYKGDEVHIPVLKLFKITPLTTIVYEIARDYNFTAHQTEDIIGLLKSVSGKYIQSSTHRIIRNRNWLIISPRQTETASNILVEENDIAIAFEQGTIKFQNIPAGKFSMTNDPAVALLDHALIKFPLLLRRWKQGDYFYPLGMQKKKKLSRFFIDQKLSLRQKEKIWVLEMDQKIIWVVGIRIDNRFKITPATNHILMVELTKTDNLA